MVRVEQLQSEYPLHWLVWNNEYKALEIELTKKEVISKMQFHSRYCDLFIS